MHLADFDTSKDEIEVFCNDCIPEELKDGILWFDDENRRVFVRSLTENAKENAEGNHPNSFSVVALETFGN